MGQHEPRAEVTRILTPVLGGLGAIGALGWLRREFRRDISEATRRLDARQRSLIHTEFGRLEYAETGHGSPLLVSHGIFHGFDGGLLAVRDIIDGRRVIAPSRFGYLGSDLPPGATAADQADAFVALLDRLDIPAADVIAISAGTSAAVQLALRHPSRVEHLIISSGSLPGSPTASVPPSWATAFYSDRAMWTLKALVRPAFAKLMGVPAGFPRTDDQADTIDELLASIFPVDQRREGAVHDAYVTNPEINAYPLEELRVPTLLVHAQDDPLASYEAAVAASGRIPWATLVGLESGGHLQLGQTGRVRVEIEAFLATSISP